MAVQGLGFHVNDVDNAAIIGHKGCTQGQEGAFHPKALLRGLLEDKDHAFVLGHVFSEHQTHRSLLWAQRHLGVNLKEAGLYFYALQIKLGALLSPEQAWGQETEERKGGAEQLNAQGLQAGTGWRVR